MDRETMSGGNGAGDAELKQWLGEICPVVTRTLKLPKPMERAADQALRVISLDTALRWLEMLRIGKVDKIRFTAQSVPDAAARLNTPEGQQAIRSWEASHRVVPVLRALKQAVKTILAFWRAGGHPRRTVIQAMAAIGVSQLVPDTTGFREELAHVIGTESDAGRLIEGYATTVVANKAGKADDIDRLISHSIPFGSWVRSFWVCVKLRMLTTKQRLGTDLELGHPLWRLSLVLRDIAGRKGKVAPGR